LIIVVGGVIGVFLMMRWWNTHGDMISGLSSVSPWVLLLGLMCLPTSMAIQLERTRRVLGFSSRKPLLHPVLMAHGVNVLLPSLLGDLYEIGALSKISGISIHRVLVRLIHRFATTLCALGILAAFALNSLSSSLALPVFVLACMGPLVVDRLTPWWSTILRIPGMNAPPAIEGLGVRESLAHIVLATAQHTLSATGVWLIGTGIGDAIKPAIAAAMLSIADLVTYLPVPLGGIGVHHWSTTAVADGLGTVPASLIAVHHGWVVLVGCACIGLAYWVRDRAE
jgi:hypothetical protein